MTPARILIVDDDPAVCRLIVRLLSGHGWVCDVAANVAEARAALAAGEHDLVLCDVGLPDGSGLELLSELATQQPHVAILVVTGRDDPALAERTLELGAYGYVTKPFRANEMLIQVSNALRRRSLELQSDAHLEQLEVTVKERTQELSAALEALRDTAAETIRRLARAIEFHDVDTGGHVERVGLHSHRIAVRLGVDEREAELVRLAAPLHDVGKIAISDRILAKRGPLTDDERSEMQTHARIGHEILAGSGGELLELAAEIALTHHERWDGGGYPRGLAGADIPRVGRIVAVADVFDALTSERPYRRRLSARAARETIREERGRAFDPAVVDAFLGRRRADAEVVG